MNITDTKIKRLSLFIEEYLGELKKNEMTEVYETTMLMLINKQYHSAINNLILDTIRKACKKNDLTTFHFESSEEYQDAVDSVCRSKYFEENFSRYEINRKKNIANNIVFELLPTAFLRILKKDTNLVVNPAMVKYPGINHKLIKRKNSQEVALTFDKDTPINDVSNYMREILEMKNMPKKRKMSLGQGYKILQIYNGIKSSGEMDGNEKYEYNEQLISREMKRRFGETLSMEAVAKSLQRIKKIQKEINTLPTNNSNQSVLY
jgi:hypothetical protein